MIADEKSENINVSTGKLPWAVPGPGARPIFCAEGKVKVSVSHEDGSVYRLARLPSSARIVSIMLQNDKIQNAIGYSLGLYAVGEGAKAKECFAKSLDLSEPLDWKECAFQNKSIAKVGNALWQDAKEKKFVDTFYDLVLTAEVAGTGSGTVVARVFYTIGGK